MVTQICEYRDLGIWSYLTNNAMQMTFALLKAVHRHKSGIKLENCFALVRLAIKQFQKFIGENNILQSFDIIERKTHGTGVRAQISSSMWIVSN